MRVLVTGAAGFLGSHVADHCRHLGMDVVGLDNLSGGALENVSGSFVKGDIDDVELIDTLCAEYHFDAIYHLAAYAAEVLSPFIRRFTYQNNMVGSATLINAAIRHKVEHFIFTSSIAVYGHGRVPMREDHQPEPIDPYGIAKYAVELDLAAAREQFGLKTVIFRPHNVYGERQNLGDKHRNVIGIFMNQAMLGRPLTIYGDGLQRRAFSHVDDVAPLIARAPLVPMAEGRIFNIGGEQTHSIIDVADAVGRALNLKTSTTWLPARHEVMEAWASHEKLRHVFNPLPPVKLSDGLARMALWAWAHGSQPVKGFGELELPETAAPARTGGIVAPSRWYLIGERGPETLAR